MAHLRLFYGQRFKSHTFQVIFNPLKGPKAAIIQKSIKIYLKNCSKEVSAKNRIYFLRGFQSLCPVGPNRVDIRVKFLCSPLLAFKLAAILFKVLSLLRLSNLFQIRT